MHPELEGFRPQPPLRDPLLGLCVHISYSSTAFSPRGFSKSFPQLYSVLTGLWGKGLPGLFLGDEKYVIFNYVGGEGHA